MTKGLTVGIIMDGNRRYAKARGVLTAEGHRAGYEKLVEVLEWVQELPIDHLIVYAFSTENWNRSKAEVTALMQLCRDGFTELQADIEKHKLRIRFIGRRSDLPKDLQNICHRLETSTKKYKKFLTIALSYGGRAEILEGVNALLKTGRKNATEATLRSHMWSKDISDPDLIIRTGGEQRLSNFLLWQCAYSELFFTPTLWPAFTKKELLKILSEFNTRTRNHGR